MLFLNSNLKDVNNQLSYKIGYVISEGMGSSVNITLAYHEYMLVSITVPKDGVYIICDCSFIENTISSVGYLFYIKQNENIIARETTPQTLGWPNYASISIVKKLQAGETISACVQTNYLNNQQSAGQAWCDLSMFMI